MYIHLPSSFQVLTCKQKACFHSKDVIIKATTKNTFTTMESGPFLRKQKKKTKIIFNLLLEESIYGTCILRLTNCEKLLLK
jgi:hypothetical protein